MKKPLALAVLAYLVPTFVIGIVWHLVVFNDIYLSLQIYRPDLVIPFGFGSILIQGLFFAAVYPRIFDTARDAWLRSALGAGALFALLSWSFTTLAVAAKHPMTSVPQYLLIETGFTVLQFLLVAPLMALAWRGRLAAPAQARMRAMA